MKASSVLETIGHTAHIRVSRLFPMPKCGSNPRVANPAGRSRTAIALAMIEDGRAIGALKPGNDRSEPTSGNTGIGLAMSPRQSTMGPGDALKHEHRAPAPDALLMARNSDSRPRKGHEGRDRAGPRDPRGTDGA